MPQIIVLPHHQLCPDGTVIDAQAGESLCQVLLDHGVDIEHACEMSCACTTCHVVVREGFETLDEADELEEDLLDKAWGLQPHSRLSCQLVLGQDDLTIEIPRYTINQTREGGGH
jgi:2Fe-2S ferredoxin